MVTAERRLLPPRRRARRKKGQEEWVQSSNCHPDALETVMVTLYLGVFWDGGPGPPSFGAKEPEAQ